MQLRVSDSEKMVWVDAWRIIEDSSEWKQFQCIIQRVCDFIKPVADVGTKTSDGSTKREAMITNNTLRPKVIADHSLLSASSLQTYVETKRK